MKQREFKDTIWYTLIMFALFMFIVPIILSIPFSLLNSFIDNLKSPINAITEDYLLFPGITLLSFVILFILKENKSLHKLFSFKNNKIIKGLLIGFGLNATAVLIAYLNGNLKFELGGTNILILLYAFVCVTVQSASEEVICRGYLYGKIMKDYKKPALAIIFNSALFSLLHLGNDGINAFTILSIFVIGVFLSLLTYYNGNIWEAAAFHTMWNFTQNFLFGLPNSGYPSPYSLLKLTSSSSSFAYDKVFGVESTITVFLLDVLVIVIVQLLNKKKLKKR